ncbi:MAG: metallophosphoesterase [Cyanobacteria bacterium P01_E01_bin.48]
MNATEPRLKFVQLSDIHLMRPGDCRCWWMTDSPDKLLQQAIAQVNAIPDLDFAVFTGDLVDKADAACFQRFQAIVSQLNVPYYCSVGNHDIDDVPPELAVGDRFNRHDFIGWCRNQFFFKPAPTGLAEFSASPRPGIHLIAIDASIGTHPDPQGVIRSQQLEWLQSELDAHPHDVVIVLIHQPPIASVFFRKYRILPAQAKQLCRVLASHSHVAAVLSGHLHVPKMYARHSTAFLTAPPLIGPVSAFRTIEIAAVASPAPSSRPAWGQLIYRWHRVRLDEAAPTPLWHAFAMGTRSDRQGIFSVNLPPSWTSAPSRTPAVAGSS